MLEHFGEDTMYISTLFSRFKSKYIFGSGQFLRLSIIDNHFFKTALELKIYIVTLIWYLFGIISLLLQFKGIFIFLKIFIIASIVLISLILLIKRNVKRTIFSLISWSLQSLGLLIGFITYKNKKVTNKLYTEIK
mgnify:FL=1